MKDTQPDKEFWGIADAFIAVANQRCETVSPGKVSAAMLYAAARFNAFIAASQSKQKQQFVAERDATSAYFVSQFEKMLRENLNDYEVHFEAYTKSA
jgi:hypothetical protein